MNEKIRALRRKKGLTQEKLAEKLGVGRTTVTLWERGIRRPNMDLLLPLAKVLGVKADYLLRS